MVCESADETCAALCFRGQCAPLKASGQSDEAVGSASTFHKHWRAEFDEIMKHSLNRRRDRLMKRVERIPKGTADAAVDPGQENIAPNQQAQPAPSAKSSCEIEAQTENSGQQDYWLEGDKRGDKLPVTKLEEMYEQAFIQSMKSQWAPPKKYGPSKRQRGFEEPPCKQEEPQREIVTIRSGLQAVSQSLNSRVKQLASLQRQLELTKEHYGAECKKVDELEDTLAMLKDPTKLSVVQEALKQLQERLASLEKQLVTSKENTEMYKKLVKQQNGFIMQAETVFFQERGAERLTRCPAGELFLIPQPLALDAKADCFDIATQFANPYEVDSWPFEPNVLARRTSKECPMDEMAEETLEELMEAQRPGRTNPFLGGLRRDARADSDSDGEPAATARSA